MSHWNIAIETSGRAGSVAVGFGQEPLAARRLRSPRRRAADLFPELDLLLRESGGHPSRIANVFLSIGPGSFTGLRIGATIARTLAVACGARVFPVPTLTAIARNALDQVPSPRTVAVVVDARRGNVYAAWFERDGDRYVPRSSPAEVEPRAFLLATDPDCAVLGEGVAAHEEAVRGTGRVILPEEYHAARAEIIYRIGIEQVPAGGVDPRTLTPFYIRPPEPEEKLASATNQTT